MCHPAPADNQITVCNSFSALHWLCFKMLESTLRRFIRNQLSIEIGSVDGPFDVAEMSCKLLLYNPDYLKSFKRLQRIQKILLFFLWCLWVNLCIPPGTWTGSSWCILHATATALQSRLLSSGFYQFLCGHNKSQIAKSKKQFTILSNTY